MNLFTKNQTILLAITIFFIILVMFNDSERRKVYEEKCINGYVILIGHSGGIAGPLGKCENEK